MGLLSVLVKGNAWLIMFLEESFGFVVSIPIGISDPRLI